MNNRERMLAVLNYERFDRMPVVHFGFWHETVVKWEEEGRFGTQIDVIKNKNGNYDHWKIGKLLGFDSDWSVGIYQFLGLIPGFETISLGHDDNGFEKIRNSVGVTELHRGDAGGIPAEIDHLLKDRKSWDEEFKKRLLPHPERIYYNNFIGYKDNPPDDAMVSLYCGSLFGMLRDIMGVEGISYLLADDEDLYVEMINTVADLCYSQVKQSLEFFKKNHITIDSGHFWEDICYKNGPLVIPSVFDEYVGPHYNRITSLLKEYDINLVSLDCDGWIDTLIPTWFENGVNIMFPIEVGTWNAEITPWRNKFGRDLRGIGGMDKRVFAADYKAIDGEIERLKPLMALGGYIPCPDHRIPPDAVWENVQYYTDKMMNLNL